MVIRYYYGEVVANAVGQTTVSCRLSVKRSSSPPSTRARYLIALLHVASAPEPNIIRSKPLRNETRFVNRVEILIYMGAAANHAPRLFRRRLWR